MSYPENTGTDNHAILSTPKKLFSKEYFNEVSKKRYLVEGHIKNFVNFKMEEQKVLEIGFGIGTDAIEFLKMVQNIMELNCRINHMKLQIKRIKGI